MQHARADYTHAHASSAREMDVLTETLELLLERHQSVLKEEGMDRQVENLKRWLESNRKHFSQTGNMPKTGAVWLADLCNGLKLAVEERQRLEGEGGLPATKEQAEQNEELLAAIRRIEKILNTDSAHR